LNNRKNVNLKINKMMILIYSAKNKKKLKAVDFIKIIFNGKIMKKYLINMKYIIKKY
jgi:hypothetical protein